MHKILIVAFLAASPSLAATLLTEREEALKLAAESPVEAVERLAKLSVANPGDSELVFELATANLRAKNYDAAIAAYQTAIDLGQQPPAAMYNIACAFALSGRTDDSIKWLQKALENRFTEDELLRTDTDLASLRDDPRYLALAGIPPAGLSRDDGWKHDLAFLRRRMGQLHWNVYAKVSREKFAAEFDALTAAVPQLSDATILARLSKIIALVGDGHTRVQPGMQIDGKTTSRRLPVDLYQFRDGLFVRGTDESQKQLVGAKVLRIGSLESQDALKRLEAYVSVDNRMGYLKWTPLLVTHEAYLREIGAIDDGATEVQLTVRRGDVDETVAVPFADAGRRGPARFGVAGFVGPEMSAETPLWLTHADDRLWCQYLPERKTAYFFFGQVFDERDQKLSEAFSELFALMDQNDVQHLIIDMRSNSGGNNFLLKPLIHGLIRRADKLNPDRGLFVIIGRETYSAAVNGLGLMEQHLNPIFVGEPAAAGPCFVGESNRIALLATGHAVTCSSRYWQKWLSTDQRTWYAPKIAAPMSYADYVAGRDPALEAIFAELAPE